MEHKLSLLVALAAAAWAGCGSPEPTQGEAAKLESAPASFRVKLETSKGDVVIEVTKAWAPEGAERFYLLVRRGFYDEARFFRVVKGFMVQFGINGNPKVQAQWRGAIIRDDPVKQSNTRGFISFAMAGPNSRTSQVFINLVDNSRLDGMGFAPFGRVVQGMEVVDRLYSGYGDGAPRGSGPDQSLIQTQGNEYLERRFPRLDYIIKAQILPAGK